MTVRGLTKLLGGHNEKRSPEELEEILRPLVLPRKSSEIVIASGGNDAADAEKGPHPILLAVQSSTREWLDDVISPLYKSDQARERQRNMDQHWAAQKASYHHFLHLDKGYHEFLPGRAYMYMRLVDRILKHWNKKTLGSWPPRSVELGCGSATLSNMLAYHGFLADIVDLSMGALRYASFLAEHQFEAKDRVTPHKKDILRYKSGGEYTIAMNSGVFEHLTTEEQKRLIEIMAEQTGKGGMVVVAVPNFDSPLYQASREAEQETPWYKMILPFLYPDPYKDNVDLPALFEHAGLHVIEYSGVSLAPSVVNKAFCTKAAVQIYDGRIEKDAPPPSIELSMKRWESFEKIVRFEDERILRDFGWYKYAIGIKE